MVSVSVSGVSWRRLGAGPCGRASLWGGHVSGLRFLMGDQLVLELVGAEISAGGAVVSGQTLPIVVQGAKGDRDG